MSKKKQVKKTPKKDKKQDLIINSNKLTHSAKNQKAYIQYMQDQGVENVNDLNFKRLNCDIPKELHCWLNVYARSNTSEYKSMTEIVIDLLGKFAKQRGFKIKNSGCECE